MTAEIVIRRGRNLVLIGLAIFLVATILASLCLGAVRISLADVISTLASKIFGLPVESSQFENVLFQLRAPRVVLAVLVGACLSVAGALMQGLFRNPLADPGLIGVSSGAALGAVGVIVFGSVFFPAVAWLSDLRFLPVAAFIGALVVTILIQRLAVTSGYTAVATLLLAGVAVNSLAGAVIGISIFLADDAQLRTLNFWTLGSLGSANWSVVGSTMVFCLILFLAAPFFAPALNALSLGESEAGHLGFPVEKVKKQLIVVTAAGVGACVAFTGVIGFIGLVVPHLIRLWIGPDHRWLLPGSALLGSIILCVADTIARTIAAPAEVPIGILTAAFGAPFFLFMLLRQRRQTLWS